jgi:hypothetical protein
MAITGHFKENQLRTYINNNDKTNIKRTKELSDLFQEKRSFRKLKAKKS